MHKKKKKRLVYYCSVYVPNLSMAKWHVGVLQDVKKKKKKNVYFLRNSKSSNTEISSINFFSFLPFSDTEKVRLL